MAADPGSLPTRTEQRRRKTRAALIGAAQRLMADGRQEVAVLEITRLADVGLGSFYNHFESKEELYRAALDDVLDRVGETLDTLTGDIDDPAEVFAQSFRLIGRLFRQFPPLSHILLRNGIELIASPTGLAPRASRDIAAAVSQGRFQVDDADVAVSLAAGAILALGALLEQQPGRDDASTTDAMVEQLLRTFGVPPDDAADICRRPLPDLAGGPTTTPAGSPAPQT